MLATSGIAAEAIAGIGLSGQMHGAVLLGADEAVLRPAIIWCDQRTDAECRWLNDTIGPQRLLDLTSNPDAFTSAMKRLGAQNLAEDQPSAIVQWLFYSHPPMSQRLAAAAAWARTHHAVARSVPLADPLDRVGS